MGEGGKPIQVEPAGPVVEMVDIAELSFDKKNARRRNDRCKDMIRRSVADLGAARSVVIDEHGRTLAGNGTLEACQKEGIRRALIVRTQGDVLVAVERSGLTESQKVDLALRDNRTTDLSTFDAEAVLELAEAHPDIDIEHLWTEEEFSALGEQVDEAPGAGDQGDGGSGDGTGSPSITVRFATQEAYDGVRGMLEKRAAGAGYEEAGDFLYAVLIGTVTPHGQRRTP